VVVAFLEITHPDPLQQVAEQEVLHPSMELTVPAVAVTVLVPVVQES
jgi:hypothetical protein